MLTLLIRTIRLMSRPDVFVDLDLATWSVYDREPAGSKPGKLWMVPEGTPDDRWLWKPRTLQRHSDETFWKGDDWAEKLATELGVLLGLPVAPVELAHRDAELGIVSRSVTGGRDLALGNQVLADHLAGYRDDQKTDLDHYTVPGVFAALTALDVAGPGTDEPDAQSVFAGYLVLDALVGNTDRHHENWGVLVGPAAGERPELAASFDHASSLGFQLSDARRQEILRDNSVEAYARRGVSRHFAGRPPLVELAVEAVTANGGAACLPELGRLAIEDIEAVVAGVPDERMSLSARTFAVRLIGENLRRLLDELDITR